MDATKLFISYPRTVADQVSRLAGDLERLGQDVWLDQELSGGQEWWDTILERIRSCDCFMFTLCEDALQSKACRAELDYAYKTHRVILPMVVGPPVPDQVLPRYLSKLQRVDASDPMQVARALLHLPEHRPLPSPLPEAPAVPISYLDELADAVDRPTLTMSEQQNLVATLRRRLAHGEDREAALTLLHRLRRRSDVYAGVAEEIDAELARYEGEADTKADEDEPTGEPGSAPGDAERPQGRPPPPGPPGPPFGTHHPPPPPPPRSGSSGKIAAVVAAGVLALGGVGAAVALSGGGDGTAPPPPTEPDPSTAPPTDGERPAPIEPVPVVEVSPGELPDTYGDDPYLDELADNCTAGSLVDCDVLYQDSPSGSAYEWYGATCGGVSYFDFSGECDLQFDADLNSGVGACDAGDMATCDALYLAAPIGSLYETFGAYCGLRSDEPLLGSCEATVSA